MTREDFKEQYRNNLLDPRWKSKRTEILERDYYICSDCFAIGEPMHVHHMYYTSGLLPWEYPDSSLITLCPFCHKTEHDRFNRYIDPERDMSLKKVGFRAKDYEALVYEMIGNKMQFNNGDPVEAVKRYIKRRKKIHRDQIERFYNPNKMPPDSDIEGYTPCL